jgi:transcriptional regulator GlxA family with amidase domain
MSAMADTPAPEDAPAVEVLFFDGFDELDSIGPWEVLSAAGFKMRAVGFPDGTGPIRAANGLSVGVDGPLGAAPGILVVPGGGWFEGPGVRALVADGVLPAAIARLHRSGTVVASVCTGAMLLAAAGLLQDRPAVTNRLAVDDLRAAGADGRDDARVVDDGDVVTSGGPLAGVDLAIRLVERFMGPDAAWAATERLEHERRGPLLVTRPQSMRSVR